MVTVVASPTSRVRRFSSSDEGTSQAPSETSVKSGTVTINGITYQQYTDLKTGKTFIGEIISRSSGGGTKPSTPTTPTEPLPQSNLNNPTPSASTYKNTTTQKKSSSVTAPTAKQLPKSTLATPTEQALVLKVHREEPREVPRKYWGKVLKEKELNEYQNYNTYYPNYENEVTATDNSHVTYYNGQGYSVAEGAKEAKLQMGLKVTEYRGTPTENKTLSYVKRTYFKTGIPNVVKLGGKVFDNTVGKVKFSNKFASAMQVPEKWLTKKVYPYIEKQYNRMAFKPSISYFAIATGQPFLLVQPKYDQSFNDKYLANNAINTANTRKNNIWTASGNAIVKGSQFDLKSFGYMPKGKDVTTALDIGLFIFPNTSPARTLMFGSSTIGKISQGKKISLPEKAGLVLSGIGGARAFSTGFKDVRALVGTRTERIPLENVKGLRRRATVIVEDKQGRVLLGLDKSQRLYMLPGGKIEKGEKPIISARRELVEETGLTDVRLKKVGTFQSETQQHYIFKAKVDDLRKLDITPKSDVAGFKFVKAKTFANYEGRTKYNPFGKRVGLLKRDIVSAEDAYIISYNTNYKTNKYTLLKNYFTKPNNKVLDFGSGEKLNPGKTMGIDVNKNFFSKEFGVWDSRVINADYNKNIPIKSSSFGKITSEYTPMVYGSAKQKAFNEAFRILQKGGTLELKGGSNEGSIKVIKQLKSAGFKNVNNREIISSTPSFEGDRLLTSKDYIITANKIITKPQYKALLIKPKGYKPILVAPHSRYDVNPRLLLNKEGKKMLFVSGSPVYPKFKHGLVEMNYKEFEQAVKTKNFSGRYTVEKSKNIRGGLGQYFQTQRGEIGYLGISYLGLRKRTSYGLNNITFKKPNPTIYLSEGKLGKEFILTPKALRGTEEEAILPSGTVVRKVGDIKPVSLSLKGINIVEVSASGTGKKVNIYGDKSDEVLSKRYVDPYSYAGKKLYKVSPKEKEYNLPKQKYRLNIYYAPITKYGTRKKYTHVGYVESYKPKTYKNTYRNHPGKYSIPKYTTVYHSLKENKPVKYYQTYKPSTINKPFKTFTYRLKTESKKAFGKLKQRGYKTFLIVKGKVKELPGIRTKSEALSFGQRRAVGSLRATFGVKATPFGVKGTNKFFKVNNELFRSYKIRKGKRIPLKDTYIQRRGKRLNYLPEIKEIQYARRKKR